ncbi:MAG: arylesterase [Proteobacteria bacterium]|nr:arylesterase [Pseudomonadota bacterium]
MVSSPSGLLTCLTRFSHLSTLSRIVTAGFLALLVACTAPPAAAATGTILVFGDSLSAAHGIRPQEGWVALLAQRLQTQGYGYRIVNASVSGETSGGGLERLPRALQLHHPQIVILELGANDGLRGLPLEGTRDNLARMLRMCQDEGARVLLAGMRIPPNYGPRYSGEFAALYPELARRAHVALVPFLLEAVALDPALMQADGLHPNARGQGPILETLWPQLRPLLGKPRSA